MSPTTPDTYYLSWTMAKRYEDCGERAHAWKEKRVEKALDETPFFMGRVFHQAIEDHLLMPDHPRIVDRYVYHWPLMEETTDNLFWKSHAEREERYQQGYERSIIAQGAIAGAELEKLTLEVEVHGRYEIEPGFGMYAKSDILGWHPTERVLYVVEAKSGKSYDAKQPDWYAHVYAMERGLDDLGYRIFAVALRPGIHPDLKVREITREARAVQEERALTIGRQMADEIWEPKLSGSCTYCEARTTCPAYQDRFGHLNKKGRVGVG